MRLSLAAQRYEQIKYAAMRAERDGLGREWAWRIGLVVWARRRGLLP